MSHSRPFRSRSHVLVILVMTTIKRRTKLWELPVNWLIVFFGNLAGSLCLVAFMGECTGSSRQKPP